MSHYEETTEIKLPDHWIKKECDVKNSLFLQQTLSIPKFIAEILSAKGINPEQFESFIHPKLRYLMSDPEHLLDIKKAVEHIIIAIKNEEKIVVYGDYDVDGATSSALIKNYMRDLKYDVDIYIPDRIEEGYGLNVNALKKLSEKYKLCIVVDSGTVAHEQVTYANSIGLDIIIIDHHISQDILPDALAIVNPNRKDQVSDCKHLAAVGVTFLVLVILNKFIKNDEYFQNIEIPHLIKYLDIVALGTVCDMVPLIGLNRAFVIQGLKILRDRPNFGLEVFLRVFQNSQQKVFFNIDEYHLGFIIGPHINSGGRIGVSDLGAKLLSTRDENLAEMYVEELVSYNKERQNEEKHVLNSAIEKVKKYNLDELRYILLYSEDWHPGVIGIVAGRIKDMYHLPTFVISFNGEIGKASARSITGINIGNYILQAKESKIIIEGGGHAMAGGFSVAKNEIESLKNFFDSIFNLKEYDMRRKLYYDSIIKISDLTMDNVKLLKDISPFGMGNSEPRFIMKDFNILNIKILKDLHIMFFVEDKKTGYRVKSIAFNAYDTTTGDKIISKFFTHILFKVKLDLWRGKEVISLNIIEVF
ncbi:single-stranded-DNA-specific exonuclease RecJ [Anaplasmataceae bacterium AB001_6]|nr:single-stranded-DNA-specific exonuclease RecJ [Anaplasmataceae bacterium AB001_6]